MDKQYLIDRLKEPSTWRGIGILLGAFGVTIEDSTIVAIGMGISALIGIFAKG